MVRRRLGGERHHHFRVTVGRPVADVPIFFTVPGTTIYADRNPPPVIFPSFLPPTAGGPIVLGKRK